MILPVLVVERILGHDSQPLGVPSRFRESDSNWKTNRAEGGILGLELRLALQDQ